MRLVARARARARLSFSLRITALRLRWELFPSSPCCQVLERAHEDGVFTGDETPTQFLQVTQVGEPVDEDAAGRSVTPNSDGF